ncbi:MAG: hypothetical protein K2X68_01710 [Novosphingobium sp.]|nr:hypothetical protein [Novosphingobium sp.]
MRALFHCTGQFMADAPGLAALADAGGSSMTSALLAVAVDIVLQGRRALDTH